MTNINWPAHERIVRAAERVDAVLAKTVGSRWVCQTCVAALAWYASGPNGGSKYVKGASE